MRYDGGNTYDARVIEPLRSAASLVGVCPEAECGMPIPREPAEIGGSPLAPAFVCVHTGRNLTSQLMPWVRTRLEEFARRPVHGFVLKSNSPSCAAVTPKYILGPDGRVAGRSYGLFARAVMQRFPEIPVADEIMLRNPRAMEGFLARAEACARQRDGGGHD